MPNGAAIRAGLIAPEEGRNLLLIEQACPAKQDMRIVSLIVLFTSMIETKQPLPRAILVGIQLPLVDDTAQAASLRELGRLVETLGYEVAGQISQRRDGLGGATVLGSGKLAELAALTGGTGIVRSLATHQISKARSRFETSTEKTPDDLPNEEITSGRKPEFVIVDHEISPSQSRNLERATGAQVLDRTGVIVEIFNRHARSREAKLQIELARLKYVAPRFRESVARSGRQQGVGAGESNLDLDRRKIRDRVSELKKLLLSIQKDEDQRRSLRRDELRVALVGYTNAGKSSLMRALTGSEVMVADKLFATLDTTTRILQPSTKPRILVSDTVGFIKHLPHDLVASFRSTLAEALEASLLLFVLDASDPAHEEQLEVTRSVLHEIGADAVSSCLVLNKTDCLDEADLEVLQAKYPDAIFVSAHAPDQIAALRTRIIEFFEASMVEDQFVLPYAKEGQLGEIFGSLRVLSQDYDARGRIVRVRGLPDTIARLRKSLVA